MQVTHLQCNLITKTFKRSHSEGSIDLLTFECYWFKIRIYNLSPNPSLLGSTSYCFEIMLYKVKVLFRISVFVKKYSIGSCPLL